MAKDMKGKGSVEQGLVRELAALLDETGLGEIEVEREGVRVRVARRVAIEAGTVGEAMVVFSSGTHVDLVFSDINLVGQLTGYAFARWLGDHHPHIPVLLTSGDATASPRTQIGIPFIPKPYVLAEVDERIKELLARGRARVSAGVPSQL